jgi:alkaline phosphatase D
VPVADELVGTGMGWPWARRRGDSSQRVRSVAMDATPAPRSLGRREFLRRSGAAAGGALACTARAGRAAAQSDESLAPFLHGVASGDPLPDGVMIWTRADPGSDRTRSVAVSWRVASDSALEDVVVDGTTEATPSADWTVKIDVRGLQPGRTYYYGFLADGAASLTGRTKTAPAAGVEHLRFGVVSCSNLPDGFFNAYARLAERDDLDAIVHLGDYLYESGNQSEVGRPADPPREIVTLDDYRARYGQYRLDPDLRRLHQQYAFINTWDDHESTNNSWYGGADNHTPDEGDWFVRKRAAAQAFSEWIPIRLPDQAGRVPEDGTRIYRTVSYGDLADLIMIDTRLEGRDEPVSETPSFEPENDDPARSILGERQEAWVAGELTASQQRGTAWRLLGNGVMLGHWNGIGLPDTGFITFLRAEGIALNGDQWDGYTASRKRLYDVLAGANALGAPITNMVVLTGDLHVSFALDLPPNPFVTDYNPVTGDGSLAVEMVTPSITSSNFDDDTGTPSDPLEALMKVANPHFKYAEIDSNGYLVLDVTRERVQGDWFHVDTVRQPSTVEAFTEAWKTDTGSMRLTPGSGPAHEGVPAEAAPATPPVRAAAGSPTGSGAADRREPSRLPATGGAGRWAGAAGLLAIGFALRLRLRRAARP